MYFNLIPTEFSDRFNAHEYEWLSSFKHNYFNLLEKTEAYLKRTQFKETPNV